MSHLFLSASLLSNNIFLYKQTLKVSRKIRWESSGKARCWELALLSLSPGSTDMTRILMIFFILLFVVFCFSELQHQVGLEYWPATLTLQ